MFLASTACTGRRAGPPSAGALSGRAVLDVENRTWEDLTIYLIREGGGPMRLGRVASLRRRQFEVMSGMLSGVSVQLQASRMAGHANRSRGFIDPSTFLGKALGQRDQIYITHPFDAPRGTPVYWVIGPETPLSSVSMP